MRALTTLGRRAFSPPFLVKFGQRQHMADLLLKGRGRISLAASFKDGSLGYARADDESLRTAFLDPSDAHHFEKFGVKVPYLCNIPIDVEAYADDRSLGSVQRAYAEGELRSASELEVSGRAGYLL